MKLNRTYKYWEFFYDEDEIEESDRQNLASVWSDSWHSVKEIYSLSEDDLREMLLTDIEYFEYGKPIVNRRKISYAINELIKIKNALPLEE